MDEFVIVPYCKVHNGKLLTHLLSPCAIQPFCSLAIRYEMGLNLNELSSIPFQAAFETV